MSRNSRNSDSDDDDDSSEGELVVVVESHGSASIAQRGGRGRRPPPPRFSSSTGAASASAPDDRASILASSTVSSSKASQGNSRAFPRLSATGSAPLDPYRVDDDDDDNDDNNDNDDLSFRSEQSLRSRLRLLERQKKRGGDDDDTGSYKKKDLLDNNKDDGGAAATATRTGTHARAAPSSGVGSKAPPRPPAAVASVTHPTDVLVLSSDSDDGDDDDRVDHPGHHVSKIAARHPPGSSAGPPPPPPRWGSQASVASSKNEIRVRGSSHNDSDSSTSSSEEVRSRQHHHRRRGKCDPSSQRRHDLGVDPHGINHRNSSSSSSSGDDDDNHSSSSSSSSSSRRRREGIDTSRRFGISGINSRDRSAAGVDVRPPRPPPLPPPAASMSRKRPLPATTTSTTTARTQKAAPGGGGSTKLSSSSSIDDYQAKKLQMLKDMERKRFGDLDFAANPTTDTAEHRHGDGATTTRKTKAMAAEEGREAARREKEERKKAADEFLQREREKKEMARVAKKAAKDAERADRQQHTAMARQASGRHAVDEIAVLMDPGLYHHDKNLYCHELRNLNYHVSRYESLLGCHAIQWVRRDYTLGGAEEAVRNLHGRNPDGYVHLRTLCVVFDDPNDFVRLLERRSDDSDEHDEDDNFPALEKWLMGVEAGWRQAWSCSTQDRPQMVLLLHKVPQRLVELRADFQARRNGVTRLPPSSEELHDAMAWLAVQFQVECVLCSEYKYLNWEIAKMTRMLSEGPYQKVYADFDCIAKLPRNCAPDAPLYEHATSTWMNQIQQLDGISFDKARNFVNHYRTGRSLWLTYQSDHMSHDDKAMLVADKFGDRRREVKASTQLHRLFTTSNPDEIL